ncbi:MAG: hypothetical protein EXR47_07640 [Dehalococcoidia bacterium]|nr:hypothetical protein [Dehalococcoidia bacterium]
MVYNSGDVGGAYQANLSVNNEGVGKKGVTFQTGLEQQVVSFQCTPPAAGAVTVGIGEVTGSFTALPADGSLLAPPTGLGDVKVIYASGIANSPRAGFLHIHGVTYDPKKSTIWVADYELRQDLFEVDSLACNNARVKPVARLHPVLSLGTTNGTEGIAIDPQDETIYYIDRGEGLLRQIDTTGKVLHELSVYTIPFHVEAGKITSYFGGAYMVVVQGDYVWVGTEALLVQLDKANKTQTGNRFVVAGTGAAYDPDHNLIWSSDWRDCTFEAYNPQTGELVFQSKKVELPVPDQTGYHRGHDLTYGGGRLWVRTESQEDDFIYGIRVE